MNQDFNNDFDKKEISENTENSENQKPVINYYDPATAGRTNSPKPPKKGSGWKKGLIIFLIVVLVVVGAGVGCSSICKNVKDSLGFSTSTDDYSYSSDYIGVVHIDGTMTSGASDEYSQTWILNRIKDMKKDSLNKGIIFAIDTPGGEVYAVDELYLAIKDYEEATGRPVYTYMESMCASGGYYTAAATEKIYANRNCWTGSIGVTLGTMYDLSELLEKYGVKTVTITSGANKAMGSSVEPMTDEQKEIFQSLVDEAYDQFTGIVAEGRKMDIKTVKKLADGRIYTAKQAKENGLIDEIGSLEDCIADMQKKYELENAEPQVMTYESDDTLRSLLGIIAKKMGSDAKNEYDDLMSLIEENGTFTITYMSTVRK